MHVSVRDVEEHCVFLGIIF